MPGLTARLEQLQDDVAWFARATELRVHVVRADPSMHEPVVRMINKGARLADHPYPYLGFYEPSSGAGGGWAERYATLEAAYAVICEALVARGKSVPPLAAEAGDGTHASFGARLLRWIWTTAQVVLKPVVILAPDNVQEPNRWSNEVLALINEQRLREVRWVLVVPETVAVAPLTGPVGAAALVTDCLAPPGEAAADLDKMIANATAAGSGATGHARAGMAWPSVAPPPPKHPVQFSPEDQAREKLRLCLLRFASQSQKQQGTDAVRTLYDAHQLCANAGLVDERLAVHLLLANTLSSVGDARRGLSELDAVSSEATTLARPEYALQAAQAKAALQAGLKDTRGAIASYAQAIALARSIGDSVRPLLIELLRAMGQLSLAHGLEPQALDAWREALTIAQAAPPGAHLGNAAEVARAMAQLCRSRGQYAQAVSLEQQADALEAAPLKAAEAEAAKSVGAE